MEYRRTSVESLRQIFERYIGNPGFRVVAPSEDSTRFEPVTDVKKLKFDGSLPPPTVSAKEFLLPRTEPLFYYRTGKSGTELIEPARDKVQTILWGLKPCDAVSFKILKKVFDWDVADDLFHQRFNQIISIGHVCSFRDSSCFCSSVGITPISPEGSDLFLVTADEKTVYLAVVTQRGKAFFESHLDDMQPVSSEEVQSVLDRVEQLKPAFDYRRVKSWLDAHFEDEFWDGFGLICLGCGRCAYICPTCHCFDIVDERQGYQTGRRMKNWDGCQFPNFTQHASGHNPREQQQQRYRQRLSHKFKYYQDRFGEILCTGCGRCSRGCPVGLDMAGLIHQIDLMG